MVEVSKYFDEGRQIDINRTYSAKIVNSESIFEPFLLQYNPDMEQ